MRPWYIGESRAQNLLVYAQGVLAKYAYQLPYQGYLEVWNALQSTIPLWVEERRGPRNAQTGQPLSLESDFKKYIDWWVYQLVAVRTGKESKVKASFVNKVFSKDPAGAVFGTRVAASTSRLAAAIEDDMAGQLDSMFQGIMDAATQFSSTDLYNLLAYGQEIMNGLTAYYAGNETRMQPIKDVLLKWMQALFAKWITASTEPAGVTNTDYPKGMHTGGMPGGFEADPNWANQWKGPTGTPYFSWEGPGKMAAVKAKLAEVLNYAVKAYASGKNPGADVISGYGAQNIAFPNAATLTGLGITGAPASLGLPLPTGYPDPGVKDPRDYEAGNDMPRSIGDLISTYNIEQKAKLCLLMASPPWIPQDAIDGAQAVVAALVATGATFLTSIGGRLVAGQDVLFQTAVKNAYMSVTKLVWNSAVAIT